VLNKEEGQATLEFALVLALILAITLFYFQLCFLFAYGNYVQYATFMSARAYMASGPDDKDQEERAKRVIIKMIKKSAKDPNIDRWPGIAEGTGGGNPKGVKIGKGSENEAAGAETIDLSWQEGVRYTFKGKVFLLPLGAEASDNYLTLTSESWLGREPSEAECKQYMKDQFGGSDVFFDNGC